MQHNDWRIYQKILDKMQKLDKIGLIAMSLQSVEYIK